MSGSKMNLKSNRNAVLAATAAPPAGGDFEWNGKDEDDRPLSKKEMREGMRKSDGHPRKANPKLQLTIRFSTDVVEYFRATGSGWQTRMDEALKEWIEEHGGA